MAKKSVAIAAVVVIGVVLISALAIVFWSPSGNPKPAVWIFAAGVKK